MHTEASDDALMYFFDISDDTLSTIISDDSNNSNHVHEPGYPLHCRIFDRLPDLVLVVLSNKASSSPNHLQLNVIVGSTINQLPTMTVSNLPTVNIGVAEAIIGKTLADIDKQALPHYEEQLREKGYQGLANALQEKSASPVFASVSPKIGINKSGEHQLANVKVGEASVVSIIFPAVAST